MKMKMGKKILIAAIITLLSATAIIGDWFVFPWQINDDVLVILHTNDEHAIIENFPQIAHKKRELEKQYRDVLLLSAGDIFSGNPVVDQYIIAGEDLRGKPMLELMELVGYDAMTIGNHDFDYGQQRLQELINTADFPILLANMKVEEKSVLEQPDSYTFIKTNTGRNVAILGLLQIGEGGIPATHPDWLEGLSFSNPLSKAAEYMYLPDKSELFIALTHLGHSLDRELAASYSELDIIIGGHSHDLLPEGKFINDVLVTQAGSNTSHLGIIKVNFDEGKIINREAKMIPIKDLDGSVKRVEKKIEEYQENMAGEMKELLISSTEPLVGKESLGSLMTDSLVKIHNLDFAFQHDGGIRINSLPPQVTVEDIYKLDPFNNSIVVRDMTPGEIRSMIYRSYVLSKEIHLRVSGLEYKIAIDEKGDIHFVDIRDNEGKILDEDKLYRVGMNSYLAHSYYPNFPKEREVILSSRTADTLIAYLRRGAIDLDKYNKTKRTAIVINKGFEK